MDTYGCNYTDDDVVGRFVIVKRGNCSFIAKALAGQRAGAAAVLVINNEPGLLRMSMSNLTDGYEVVIPLAMLLQNSTESLLRYATARGPGAKLHGVLKPIRDECVDPAEEDAERRQLAEGAGVRFTASLVSRLAPSWRNKPIATVPAQASDNATTTSIVAAGGDAEILANTTDQQQAALPADRLPGTWPAAPTDTSLLHLSMPHQLNQALGDVSDLASHIGGPAAEGSIAHFSAPILGDSSQVAFADPPDACTPALANPDGSLAGKTVIVYRGTCTMVDKARHVQAAGAAAMVLVNTGAEPSAIIGGAWRIRCERMRRDSAGSSLPPQCSDDAVMTSGAGSQGQGQSSVGTVQAIGDGQEKEKPVSIPVVMVSAAAASGWVWLDDDGITRNISGVTAVLAASRAPASAWDDLIDVSARGGAAWPEDTFHRQRMMLQMLRLHHTQSSTGHAERHTFLHSLAAAAGHGRELAAVESSLSWEGGLDLGHVSDDFGADTSVNTVDMDSPGHAYLIRHLGHAGLGVKAGEGVLRCRVESGLTYNVRLPDFDRTSTFGLTMRLTDLLAQQACLEKLLTVNGAVVGHYLAQLREESTPREWRELSRALLRPYAIPDVDVTRTTSSYIELARAVRDAAMPSNGNGGSGDSGVGSSVTSSSAASIGRVFEEQRGRRLAKAMQQQQHSGDNATATGTDDGQR